MRETLGLMVTPSPGLNKSETATSQTGIEVKGDMELSVYNDKLNLSCKIAEMSAYVKPPYTPNN